VALKLEHKQAIVAEVNEAAGKALSAVLADYRGLTVTQMTEMRAKARASGVYMRVIRNTLAKRALKGTPFEPLDVHFAGTTAVAYTAKDPVALAKALTTFAKSAPAVQIKAAIVQGRAIKPSEVTDLATLPGKPELYAKLLFLLQAPMVQLVSVLNAAPSSNSPPLWTPLHR